MTSPNQTAQSDLSEGLLSEDASLLASDILKEQQQKRRFRSLSFAIAWFIAAMFLLAVLCFSYRIVYHPNQYRLPAAPQAQEANGALPATDGKTPGGTEEEIRANPGKDNTHTGNSTPPHTDPVNQLLLLLSLLSAVGTTLAISVMRFSFSNGSKLQDKESPGPISPIAASISETLKALADLLKKDK